MDLSRIRFSSLSFLIFSSILSIHFVAELLVDRRSPSSAIILSRESLFVTVPTNGANCWRWIFVPRAIREYRSREDPPSTVKFVQLNAIKNKLSEMMKNMKNQQGKLTWFGGYISTYVHGHNKESRFIDLFEKKLLSHKCSVFSLYVIFSNPFSLIVLVYLYSKSRNLLLFLLLCSVTSHLTLSFS